MSAEIVLVAAGVDAPEWGDLARGQRPGFHPDDEFPRKFDALGGSPSLLQPWRALSSRVQCGQGWDPLSKRLPPFTARAHGWDSIPLFPNVTGVSFGPAMFSHPSPAPPLVPALPLVRFLPVWPAT